MPNQGKKNKRNIILVSAILLFSLSLMTLNVKQEKGAHFVDSITAVILSPFQNFFSHTIQSASDSISHYFFLVDVARQNNQLKLTRHLTEEYHCGAANVQRFAHEIRSDQPQQKHQVNYNVLS